MEHVRASSEPVDSKVSFAPAGSWRVYPPFSTPEREVSALGRGCLSCGAWSWVRLWREREIIDVRGSDSSGSFSEGELFVLLLLCAGVVGFCEDGREKWCSAEMKAPAVSSVSAGRKKRTWGRERKNVGRDIG